MRIVLVPVLLLLVACGGGGMTPTGPSTPPSTQPPPAPPTTTPPPTTTMPPSGTNVLRSAQMRGANGHSVSGTARIVQEGSRYALEFLSDLRVDIGSIDVYLARASQLDMRRDLNLGALKSRTGAQSYPLPDAASEYRYVILWCRPFGIPIGIGELR